MCGFHKRAIVSYICGHSRCPQKKRLEDEFSTMCCLLFLLRFTKNTRGYQWSISPTIYNNIFETHRHAHQLEQTSFGVLVGSLRAKSDKIELLWTSQYMYIDIFEYTCLIMHIRPPTEFWKWKKVRAPQVSEKVRDRNQDKRLATLRTFKKKNFGNSNFRILIL